MIKYTPSLALAIACVACGGASFTSHDDSGGSGSVATAGDSSGGLASTAGDSSVGNAGEVSVGGASAGQGSTAGAGSGMGRGGWGNGGWWSGNAGAAGVDCTALAEEYRASIDKARVCDKGSTDQCSPSSAAEPVDGCGCPVLINTASEAANATRKAYQAYQRAGCARGGGPICDIFCPPATAASCEQQASGPGSTFVCTASTTLQK